MRARDCIREHFKQAIESLLSLEPARSHKTRAPSIHASYRANPATYPVHVDRIGQNADPRIRHMEEFPHFIARSSGGDNHAIGAPVE
jgi:hypothetical protein